MKQNLNLARRAAALLIAAAALPLTPVFAQDAQPPVQPPPAAQPAPDTAPAPAAQVPPVAVPPLAAPAVTPAPVPTANIAPFPATTPSIAPVRSTPAARAAPRSAARASAATASRSVRSTTTTAAATRPASAQKPAHVDFVAPSQPAASAPVAASTPAAAPPPVATDRVSSHTESTRSTVSLLPWLVIGLLLLGVAAFALARRRRREDVLYDETYDEAAVAPVAVPAAEAGVGRPWLDLALEPVRAGVEGKEAVVEFALKLDNHGVAPARDVRVSTFMLQGGASDAERSLIEPKDTNIAPPVTIAAGEAKQVRTTVALPTNSVTGDSVLPVVVADARYTLPDGSEGRTSASFAVGVPDGEELAHFAVDNPSGLHDDVVARALGEMEKA